MRTLLARVGATAAAVAVVAGSLTVGLSLGDATFADGEPARARQTRALRDSSDAAFARSRHAGRRAAAAAVELAAAGRPDLAVHVIDDTAALVCSETDPTACVIYGAPRFDPTDLAWPLVAPAWLLERDPDAAGDCDSPARDETVQECVARFVTAPGATGPDPTLLALATQEQS